MKTQVVAGLMTLAGFAAAASAETILSFGFTDMSGSFNAATMAYTSVGVDTPTLKTAGNVNRHLDPVLTAVYGPGTAANKVQVSLTVSGVLGTTADGNGSIFIEDADGDRFVANITGTFSLVAPAVFFNGLLSNIAFLPRPGTNNMFDGPTSGSFPLTFAPSVPPFEGALVQLHFDTAGTFFSQSFAGVTTQLNGAVIPAPGTLGLLGLGMLAMTRRRRAR
jgi:hypothetical protein